jgi:hypothetical protein
LGVINKMSKRPIKRLMYDPPSGWKFGFPKEYTPHNGLTVKELLIKDGYPPEDAEFASKHTRYWTEDVE